MPQTEKEWENIAYEYEKKWNVYNTIGALDGKHIRITCPQFSGSHFFNYKHFNSIVLLALTDANYKFIFVDVGTNGRIGDAGVFAKSSLKKCLIDRSILNIPKEKILPGTTTSTPYVVLADDAFPLSYNVIKPYPLRNITNEEKICNYRISRGRRMVESSFGILASRFRVLLTPINLSPDKVTKIVLAACSLHNLLVEQKKHFYTQKEVFTMSEGISNFLEERALEETPEMTPLSRQIDYGHRHGREVRETFKTFYNGVGKVPWQDKYS